MTERGNATLQVAAAALLLTLVAAVFGWGLVYRYEAHRVQGAADLAALAGAEELRRGGDACAVARRAAKANGARVERCTPAGDEVDYVVQITVSGQLKRSPLGVEGRVTATATAGVLA